MSSSEHISRVRKLYKLIFRVHRALPPELRIMGNNYARDEFKRHKNCRPEEARIFMNEWTDYAIRLAKQLKPLNQAKKKTVGMPLDPSLLDHMTEDQVVQLYELHKAANADVGTNEIGPDSDVTPRDPQVDIQFDNSNEITDDKNKKGMMETQFHGDDDKRNKNK